MEVAWRGSEQLSRNPAFDMKSKKKQQASSSSWGVDAHKVLQLMMGQQQQQPDYSTSPPASSTDAEEATLDLLGLEAANSSPPPSSDHNNNFITEFPELDPDQPRLPPDWKTCLDLKTGKLSFVNKTTGITSESDPRKQPLNVAPLMAIEPSTHEFLGSKKSEILLEESLQQQQQQRTGSSSSTSGSAFGRTSPQMLSFSTGTQVWNLQLADHSSNISLINDVSCCTGLAAAEDRDHDQAAHERSNLKLDLNLTAGAGGSPSRTPREQEQSVCNMEMVQRALRLRTDHPAASRQQPDHQCRKSRDQPFPIAAGNTALPKLSGSPAVLSSSLIAASTRGSDPAAATWSSHGGSPSTSSSTSSTTSSRSRQQQLDHGNQAVQLAVAADSSHTGRQPAAATTPSSTIHEAEGAQAAAAEEAILLHRHSSSTGSKIISSSLVMGACTRCLMYIMLDKCDPKCPRCGSTSDHTPLDFAPPLHCSSRNVMKRQRSVEQLDELDLMRK
ncbi:unnamed protein product [Sphagnum troendelagicum]|uniref:GIR1-like zinc ribbon domain-containing protein n=1 Tax=Sphagnum troendelagicum TaxID=128251 RepID=A0ABP0UAE8_9BRYO